MIGEESEYVIGDVIGMDGKKMEDMIEEGVIYKYKKKD